MFRTNHWFDEFSQVHRFQIHAPTKEGDKARVTYNSRLTSDGLIAKVRQTGRLDGLTFGAKYEPCKTFFQKLQSFFRSAASQVPQALPQPNEANIGVTMSINFPGLSPTGQAISGPVDTSRISSVCTKTDASVVQMLDSETLEPIGLARQVVLHPELKGPLSGAHAKSDPETGDVYNFNLQLGSQGTYRVFRVSASTGETSILATVHHSSAYLHSIWLTEHFVVLCIWNSHFKAGGLHILLKQNLADAMEYTTSQPAKWVVIDKRPAEEGGQGIIATYESPPFFGFHTVNAYEETSEDGVKHIIADIPAYESLEVLKAYYLDNAMSDSPSAGQVQGQWGNLLAPKYRRYRFPDVPDAPRAEPREAVLEFELDRQQTLELPQINGSVYTKKHRYVYGIFDSGKSTFADSLMKLDLEDKSVKRWSVHGHTAGEPIFIADPNSNAEDGGVLLTVVLDGIAGRSYLLVLDARDLSEMGRANVDGVVGFGFHGIHAKAHSAQKISISPEY